MISYKSSEPRPPIMEGSPPRLRVPFADWDRPPWNRWSFQHVRELLPTAEVWRGEGTAAALASSPVDLDDLALDLVDGTRSNVGTFLDESYTDGFLVLHRGRVLFERYFNGMIARTLHLSQSMAKSVTAACAGVLVGERVLDPEALITRYLPELETTAYREAELRHVTFLLQHRCAPHFFWFLSVAMKTNF